MKATNNMRARAAFGARYIGNGIAIVAHQMSTPEQAAGFRENTGSYGGGFDAPVTHRLAFVGVGHHSTQFAAAEIGVHQPQAIGYRPQDDAAFIAGLGSDEILLLTDASQATVRLKQISTVRGTEPCGPTGVAPADGQDNEILVWCSMSRRVARIAVASDGSKITHSDPIARSRYGATQHRGMELFFGGDNAALSSRGALACGSCHPEGRTDGLSWRIEKRTLQTPILSGRVAGTHPFKWDGGDESLNVSLVTTTKRLGGFGLQAQDAKALAAFIEAMPAPRAPTPDRKAIARGAKLFRSDDLGCATCHSGS
jgi:cytochrome c553